MFGTPTLDTATIGIKTIYLQSNGTVRNLQFQNNLGFVGSVTNISVKEVGQDWSIGTGWSIEEDANGNSVAKHQGTFGQIIQDINLDESSNYIIELDLTVNAGAFFLDLGSANYVKSYNSSQHVVFYHSPTGSNNKLYLTAQAGFDGSITNISVKEITDDTNIPRINYEGFSYQDSLGSEEVVNGDFSNGNANFLKSNNAYITTNSCNFDNTSDNTVVCFIQQNGILQSSKSYKVTINVSNYVTGDLKLIGVSGIKDFQITQSGQYTLNVEATQINLVITCDSGVDCNITIDNVSVKEVTGQEVVPDSGCGSWLLEGQSTNTVRYSEEFSNAEWGQAGSPTLTSG